MSPTLSSAAPAPRRRPGGPPRWTAADKTAALAAFATSGLSLKAFCLARGVPRATFTLWQREARAARTTPNVSHEVAPEVPRVAPRAPRRRRDRPTFATVELVPAPTPRGIPRVVAQGLVLLVRGPAGIEAELTGLDAATVVTVVTVVGAILAPRRER